MKFKKSLGQNLLIDKNILRKITSLTKISKKNVIEIGPGTGNLSFEILKFNPCKLLCIEKDRIFSSNLKKLSKDIENLFVINSDILRTDLKSMMLNNTVIFGNLPYNISSQILIKFIKINPWPPNFERLIFMFQKEVGEKIIADYGNKNYSRLSIITKSRLKIKKYFYVSKNCFLPKPKVDSIVIEFKPYVNGNLNLKSINTLEYITNFFFSNKRKMINKALKKLNINDQNFLKKEKINTNLRPENLTEKNYYKIAEFYEKIVK